MGASDEGETGEERSQPGGEARRPGARIYIRILQIWQRLADFSVNLPIIGDGMHGTTFLTFISHSEARTVYTFF